MFSVTRRSTSDESHSLTDWVSILIDFSDVTLVSEDSYRRLHWCNPDDSDEHEDHDDPEECIFWKCILQVYFLKVYFLKVYF